MASYFWREMFYVPFPGTPGKIPGNSGSTELRKEFGTTLTIRPLPNVISILTWFTTAESGLSEKVKHRVYATNR